MKISVCGKGGNLMIFRKGITQKRTEESAKLAVKIGELSGRLQKPVYYVLNKVDEESRKVLEQAIGDPERILAVLPVEPELTKAALLGQKLILENSELNQAAKKICRTQI